MRLRVRKRVLIWVWCGESGGRSRQRSRRRLLPEMLDVERLELFAVAGRHLLLVGIDPAEFLASPRAVAVPSSIGGGTLPPATSSPISSLTLRRWASIASLGVCPASWRRHFFPSRQSRKKYPGRLSQTYLLLILRRETKRHTPALSRIFLMVRTCFRAANGISRSYAKWEPENAWCPFPLFCGHQAYIGCSYGK